MSTDSRPLVVRNGLVVDGTGAPAVHADVAIRDGIVVEVGPGLATTGADVIDADGLVVTPGFVDIHTHFDGQATWDPMLAPSSLHGVTSVAMGNCGVGFAPAKPTAEQHDWLIGMLEGVEDIPGTALAEGLPWDWESFPDYLDALDRRQYTVDIGTHVVHAPLRAYVMGERGADPNEAPTADELLKMADAVRDGVRAGALGFTTSRTIAHRTRDGLPLGTRYSSEDELAALVGAMAETGTGVVQLISDAYLSEDETFAREEMALMRSLVEQSGRPLSMTTQQVVEVPDRWREMLAWVAKGVADGLPMRNQVAPRPVGVLQGLTASVNPIALCPSFREIANLPLADKVAALRDPDRQARIVAEHPDTDRPPRGDGDHDLRWLRQVVPDDRAGQLRAGRCRRASPPVPRPAVCRRCRRPSTCCSARTATSCCSSRCSTSSTATSTTSARCCCRRTPSSVSATPAPTAGRSPTPASRRRALALWTKRTAGAGPLPLELMVHHLTQRTARQVGWLDRGVLAPGHLGDVNVIDIDSLGANRPRIIHDLPAGGRRLMQSAAGYVHTVKRGTVTFSDGTHTGALPGGLVRGAQPTPA